MPRTEEFDVVIVGASLAGCATAILLGREGLSVALVDKHGDEEAFKRLCGHYLQASATPTLERLGLAGPIEAVGGVQNGIETWTRWGVIEAPTPLAERTRGFSLRRKKLDPLIRRVAADLPSVDYRPRLKLVALDRERNSASVELESPDGARTRLKGRLVVGADGRNSALARLAGVKERRAKNKRFCYAGYFTDVTLQSADLGRMWMLDPKVAVAVPQDSGLSALAVFPHESELASFAADPGAALLATIQDLPGVDLSRARQEDKILGYKDYDLVSRAPIAGSSVALIGDAALSSDPVMAVGCGWALQSAGWLADAVIAELEAGEDVGRGLRRYRRLHRRNLGGHHRLNILNARARPLDPARRMLIAAAVNDPVVAQRLSDFGERTIGPRKLLAPTVIGRAMVAR